MHITHKIVTKRYESTTMEVPYLESYTFDFSETTMPLARTSLDDRCDIVELMSKHEELLRNFKDE